MVKSLLVDLRQRYANSSYSLSYSLCSTGVGHFAVPKLKLSLTDLSFGSYVQADMAPCLSLNLRAANGLTGALNSKGPRTTLPSEVTDESEIKVS